MQSLDCSYVASNGAASEMDPTFTVIIPTREPHRPLERTLLSITHQELVPGDQVIIVGDIYDGPLAQTEALVTAMHYEYLAHDAGQHYWGNPQRNYALPYARGDYLLWIDDDDIFTKHAFAIIRDVVRGLPRPCPVLFRFRAADGRILWQDHTVRLSWIGGHEFVTPNLPDKLGYWGNRYAGDFDFIRSTLDLWGGDQVVVWREEMIAISRPTPEEVWV